MGYGGRLIGRVKDEWNSKMRENQRMEDSMQILRWAAIFLVYIIKR